MLPAPTSFPLVRGPYPRTSHPEDSRRTSPRGCRRRMAAPGPEWRAASAQRALPEVPEPRLLPLQVFARPGALDHPGHMGGRPCPQFKLSAGPGGAALRGLTRLLGRHFCQPTPPVLKGRGRGPRLGWRAEPGRSNKWTWPLGRGAGSVREETRGRLSSSVFPTWSVRQGLGHSGPAPVSLGEDV